MSALKDSVVSLVKDMPDDSTLDDIMAELYFKTQIDAGLRELDAGLGISHADVEKRMGKWLTA